MLCPSSVCQHAVPFRQGNLPLHPSQYKIYILAWVSDTPPPLEATVCWCWATGVCMYIHPVHLFAVNWLISNSGSQLQRLGNFSRVFSSSVKTRKVIVWVIWELFWIVSKHVRSKFGRSALPKIVGHGHPGKNRNCTESIPFSALMCSCMCRIVACLICWLLNLSPCLPACASAAPLPPAATWRS